MLCDPALPAFVVQLMRVPAVSSSNQATLERQDEMADASSALDTIIRKTRLKDLVMPRTTLNKSRVAETIVPADQTRTSGVAGGNFGV